MMLEHLHRPNHCFDTVLWLSPQMAGSIFAAWWTKMGPYYSKAYQEVWVGVGIMAYAYYKLSYGGEFKT